MTLPTAQLILKPPALSWEVAGSLYVVACTAYAAVRAIQAQPGETVAVSAASGGVGNLVVQLLVHRQVHVPGIASSGSDEALTQLGAVPVHYGEGLEGRLSQAAPAGIDAFIDLFGPEYVHLAVDSAAHGPKRGHRTNRDRHGIGHRAARSAELEHPRSCRGVVSDGV